VKLHLSIEQSDRIVSSGVTN